MGWDKLSGTGVSQKKFHTARSAQLVACPHSNFLKILSSKRVCCVFRDSCNKNAVTQCLWSKTMGLAFLQQKCMASTLRIEDQGLRIEE